MESKLSKGDKCKNTCEWGLIWELLLHPRNVYELNEGGCSDRTNLIVGNTIYMFVSRLDIGVFNSNSGGRVLSFNIDQDGMRRNSGFESTLPLCSLIWLDLVLTLKAVYFQIIHWNMETWGKSINTYNSNSRLYWKPFLPDSWLHFLSVQIANVNHVEIRVSA